VVGGGGGDGGSDVWANTQEAVVKAIEKKPANKTPKIKADLVIQFAFTTDIHKLVSIHIIK
jgi:hypothetical protein